MIWLRLWVRGDGLSEVFDSFTLRAFACVNVSGINVFYFWSPSCFFKDLLSTITVKDTFRLANKERLHIPLESGWWQMGETHLWTVFETPSVSLWEVWLCQKIQGYPVDWKVGSDKKSALNFLILLLKKILTTVLLIWKPDWMETIKIHFTKYIASVWKFPWKLESIWINMENFGNYSVHFYWIYKEP